MGLRAQAVQAFRPQADRSSPPPPPATRTPPCSRERSRSVRVPLPAAGVPSQHPLPRWLATAADTPRPRLPCLQAR